jgi:HEAT repeat protein
MADSLPRKAIPFRQVLDDLIDETRVFPAVNLHRFSDLNDADMQALKAIWKQVSADRRAALLEDLEELYDSDTLISFDEIARFALLDSNARVRAGALRLLWDYQGKDLIPAIMQLLEKDPDEIVRALAASLMGQFIFLGELEQISASMLHAIEELLFQTVESGENKLVRRRALESLGYSSRDEVNTLIQNAFDSGDLEWMASALFAMGRSGDEKWASSVIEMLDHHERDLQIEAVRAAGALELDKARKPLLQMIRAGIDDADLRTTAAWSLSQIGGDQVGPALAKLLKKAEDEEEAEFIQTAIDNLEFQNGLDNFELMDFSPARRADFQVTAVDEDDEGADSWEPEVGEEEDEESEDES